MTPLGEHLNQLRAKRGITQKEMAKALGVSPAYLSALEHGNRGTPSWAFLQRVVGYLNVIWDEAELLQNLAALSDPKVAVETAGLSPNATMAANLLAKNIGNLSQDQLQQIIKIIEEPQIPDEASKQ